MPRNPDIEALLAQLPTGQDLDFMRLLEAVHTVRYTGPLTIDFLTGTPMQINLGPPLRLSICHGEPTPPLQKVDKPPRSRAG